MNPVGAQAGIYSASLLMLHNHLNDNLGGVLNEYSRYGAYRRFYRTGAGLIHTSGGTPAFNVTGVMTVIKRLRIDETRPGQTKINYAYASGGGGVDHVEARFYVNGVPVGVLQHGAGAIVQENYDVGFTKNDLIEIWGRRITAGDQCDISNFYIEYDWAIPGFGDGSFNNLNAALPVSDVDEMLHTEIL